MKYHQKHHKYSKSKKVKRLYSPSLKQVSYVLFSYCSKVGSMKR